MNRLQRAKEFRKQFKTQNEVVKSFIRIDELTEEEMLEIIYVYSEYELNKEYKIGDTFKYENKLYKVIQAHTSQEDWKPNEVASLYKGYMSEDVIDNWKQPQGAHDAYNKGDKVLFNNEIYVSTVNGNVWQPKVYGWELDVR